MKINNLMLVYKIIVRALAPLWIVFVSVVTLNIGVSLASTDVATLATLGRGASLQGIYALDDGTVYLSVNNEDVIMRYNPEAGMEVFAKLPIHPHGIVPYESGFVVTGQVNRPHPDSNLSITERFSNLGGRVLVVNETGNIEKEIKIGANTFPNGIVHLSKDTFLVADSLGNAIWAVDVRTGSVTKWSDDPLIRAEPNFPGANGIKIHNGFVYVSNTVKQQVMRIRLGGEGQPVGTFQVFGTAPRVDDITIAEDGTVYAASHGPMTKITPDGTTSKIFEDVPGGSALMLAHDEQSIYALTDSQTVNGEKSNTYLLQIWLP